MCVYHIRVSPSSFKIRLASLPRADVAHAVPAAGYDDFADAELVVPGGCAGNDTISGVRRAKVRGCVALGTPLPFACSGIGYDCCRMKTTMERRSGVSTMVVVRVVLTFPLEIAV